MSNYSGADWLKGGIGAENISAFGAQVANILGDVYFGIYHLDYKALKKVDWKNTDWIEIVVFGGLSTFDYDQLTRLVVLCHDRAVRLEIKAASYRYLRLCFSPRTREGNTYERHPILEEAAANIRKAYAQ